jgi:hypothetical protein
MQQLANAKAESGSNAAVSVKSAPHPKEPNQVTIPSGTKAVIVKGVDCKPVFFTILFFANNYPVPRDMIETIEISHQHDTFTFPYDAPKAAHSLVIPKDISTIDMSLLLSQTGYRDLVYSLRVFCNNRTLPHTPVVSDKEPGLLEARKVVLKKGLNAFEFVVAAYKKVSPKRGEEGSDEYVAMGELTRRYKLFLQH